MITYANRCLFIYLLVTVPTPIIAQYACEANWKYGLVNFSSLNEKKKFNV